MGRSHVGRGKLPIGSEWYLTGGNTKVRVVAHVQTSGKLKSKCLILEAKEWSKFHEIVGTDKTVDIINGILYPRKGR